MAINPTIAGRQTSRPRLGVSQCLLGERVRYDAASQANRIVLQELAALFSLVPVCPEVEAGLGVPRAPVQLSGDILNPRMTGRDQPELDVTAQILAYSRKKLPELALLDGFVFKSRSPSCGLNTSPVFINGLCVTETSRGLFARGFCQQYPQLPVIEDISLESPQSLREFIAAVENHYLNNSAAS